MTQTPATRRNVATEPSDLERPQPSNGGRVFLGQRCRYRSPEEVRHSVRDAHSGREFSAACMTASSITG